MPHKIRNHHLELTIDLPNENYQAARFDWTGKIVDVVYRGLKLTTSEQLNSNTPNALGRGLYNEFGIDSALGFDAVEPGHWFHKIGVGLLKKVSDHYLFHDSFEIEPCNFSVLKTDMDITIICESPVMNGYGYLLEKKIALKGKSILISYQLSNTGKKEFTTEEYNHNFLSIGNELLGKYDVLKFPLQLNPNEFREYLNPKEVVQIHGNEITIKEAPISPFFFSEICTSQASANSWTLENLEHKIGLKETTSFVASKVNFWGCGHVISPELFHTIKLMPGQTENWWRRYDVYDLH